MTQASLPPPRARKTGAGAGRVPERAEAVGGSDDEPKTNARICLGGGLIWNPLNPEYYQNL